MSKLLSRPLDTEKANGDEFAFFNRFRYNLNRD